MLHISASIAEPSGGLAGLSLALFLAGLAGSFTHCVGMCGPFVIAQVGAALDRAEAAAPRADYGTLRRLRGAALLPYHFGRMTTYAVLGAAGATVLGFVANIAAYRVLAALLLSLAAMAMLAQALGRGLGFVDRLLTRLLPRHAPGAARGLLVDPGGWRGYALGVVLGFLPCGMLYAALAAASATGHPLHGAVAMAAFAAGTVPGLAGVGWAGALFGRRWKRLTGIVATLALLASAVLLLAIALRLVA
jgi:sulfite exporter TauE/SafE